MSIISVIIPAYNAQQTIAQTIESVRQQAYRDLEIIIINDGSTDKTLDEIAQFNDRRIKVYNYPNGGVAEARNRGIARASGEYIAFLDADDLWTSDKLELQYRALQDNPQAGVAYSWTYFLYAETNTCFPSEAVYHRGNVYPQLLIKNFLHHGSNPLIRRAAVLDIGNFNANFPHCADWDYYLRLAAKYKFIVVPQHQIYYLQLSNSMTSKISAIEQQLCEMLTKTYRTVPQKLKHLQKQSRAWIYQYCTQQYLEYGRDRESTLRALSYLGKSVRSYPPILWQKYTYSLFKWSMKSIILGIN